MDSKIAVIYLDRYAEGNKPVRRFLRSYRSNPGGIDHEFITIYKGFPEHRIAAGRRVFEGLENRHVVIDDDMTDIDSYLLAAQAFPDLDVLCFLNTFSEIACANWLSNLSNAACRNDVGIAGASASYESLFNSLKLIAKVGWLCLERHLKYDRNLHRQYGLYINTQAPGWVVRNGFNLILGKSRRGADANRYLEQYDAAFQEYWRLLVSPDGIFSFLNGYPHFPNPNVRTNGFMIRRDLLLSLKPPSRKMTKNESYLFESGASSMTRRIQDQGLKALVVNNHGDIYDVAEWPLSRTFRLGKQEALLVRDNQTRSFDRLNPAEKRLLTYMSWGESAVPAATSIFTFGIPFGDHDRERNGQA